MSNRKATGRALFASVMALVLCLAMLVGSTFAWFTDTASTGVNKIQAGNLKMEVTYKNAKDGAFTPVTEQTNVFKQDTLWEPGHVEYAVLKVENKGTLALKYQLGINIASETGSKNVNGEEFKLSQYIKYAVLEGDQSGLERAALVAEAGEGTALSTAYTTPAEKDTILKAGEGVDPATVTLVVWMPDTVGNEANHAADAAAPVINLGISVVATQATVEEDSFDDQYDANAKYPAVVYDAAGLKTALADGGNVQLGSDVDPDITLVAKDNTATIDANGKTIANTADVWDKSENGWSLVSAQDSANLTITGNGTFKAKENDCYAVDVQDGSTLTIEDGTFIGNIHAVYVQEGTAYIKGGFYSVQQKYPDASKADEFVLNCYDANREAGTAKIIVTGGTFVNFNPADCWAEGAHTNFVAEGYKVVSETQSNGDIWYTVVAK